MFDYTDCNKHGQGWDLDMGFTYGEYEPHKWRIGIHHDTSYNKQSSAHISVWSDADLEWHTVLHLMWQEWATETRPVDPVENCYGGTSGMWAAVEELQSRAFALVRQEGCPSIL